jgi:hypothetical protein
MAVALKPISEQSFQRLVAVMESLVPLSFRFKLALRKVLQETGYERGAQVLNFGDRQLVIWFLLSGLLREVRMRKSTLREYTSWFFLPDSFVYSDPGFFSQQPSTRGVEAAVTSGAVLISYADWSALKAAFGEMELLTERIRAAFSQRRLEHMEDMNTLSVQERYLDNQDMLNYLFPRTQLTHIAEFMGMAPDTLGRLRSKYYGGKN